MILDVIDMLPGSGKTQGMNMYLSQTKDPFIYLTPYNEEVDNIQAKLNRNSWTELQQLASKSGLYRDDEIIGPRKPSVPDSLFTKSRSMMRQIQKGKCIACTHELFRRLCLIKSFWTLLEGKGYTLIIDEELPLIRDYQFSRCTFRDMKFYLMRPFEGEEPIVSVEEDGLLNWNSKARDAGNGAFHRLKKDIRSNCLCLEGGRVKWRIPLQNFAVFSKVYLMTYRFEGSIFHRRWESVMGADSIRYCHFKDNDIVEGKWQIPQERVDNLRRRLKIAGPSAYPSDVGKAGHYSYSMEWYKSATRADFESLVKKMQYFIKYGAAGKRLDRKKILWTTFKAYREIIEELDVGNDSFRPKRGDVETFIPLNMRASNSYLDRNVVFYLVDRYVGLNEPGVDRNKLSLDELLQFLFRTCLRLPDSEEVVYAYIPSERMRRLLERWLDNPV